MQQQDSAPVGFLASRDHANGKAELALRVIPVLEGSHAWSERAGGSGEVRP